MGTSVLIMVSILSAVEVLFILSSSEHVLKAFLGYKIWVDIVYGLGLTLYMGMTGTISGVAIAAFSGFFMTMTLLIASKVIGYRKRKMLDDGTFVWVEYSPTLTIQGVVSSTKGMMDKSVSYCKSLYTSSITKGVTSNV